MIPNAEGTNTDYGMNLRNTAGEILNSEFTVECNGVLLIQEE